MSIFTLLGAAIGALGGYLYYRFIGCNSGACPLTQNPYTSTLGGALLGALLIDFFI